MKYGKGIAALLCTALLAGTLAGCGKKEADAGMEPVKGRYTEREEALPTELEGWTVKQMFIEEEKVHLLAAGPPFARAGLLW